MKSTIWEKKSEHNVIELTKYLLQYSKGYKMLQKSLNTVVSLYLCVFFYVKLNANVCVLALF